MITVKKIIAVCGERNVGKTTSIILAKNLLIKSNPQAKITDLTKPRRKDICVKVEINGETIIFASTGDPGRVQEMLEEIANENWDTLICATRTSGGTVEAVKGAASDIRWIEKKRAAPLDYDVENEKTAREILGHI